MTEVSEFAGDEILQATGSRDDEFAATTKALNLRLLRHAADDQRRLWHFLVAQLFVLFVNLHGQFTGRQQDQSANALHMFMLCLFVPGCFVLPCFMLG